MVLSGITVNGEVGAAKGRPNTTYFTKIFIALGSVNITVSPRQVVIHCPHHLPDNKFKVINKTLFSVIDAQVTG